MELSGLSGQSSEDKDATTISTNFFRLPCGKLRQYSTLKDYGQFGKVFLNSTDNWGSGPYKNWRSMIVNSDANNLNYLKPYPKDIDGNFFKEEDGSLHHCKNCLAYGKWIFCSGIMILNEGCLSCMNSKYINKVMRIQKKWREYKHIDKTFEWDW
jgi:hypothetical protein